MKIENNHEAAYVSKNVETFQATISMTPEVFELMISGVYKDKFTAPSRELICNARDSHVEAKVNMPLKIHAPTAMEPWFSVQDFGLGMSHEMVTQTYMCIGSSTKRSSNELIGAKGIGSKSPFALVDAFQVMSVFDGVQTSYSIFKNRGLPDGAALHHKPTTDHNGVEVKFSIDPKLMESFNESLKAFLMHFDYPYDINIDVPEPFEVAYEGSHDGFTIKILTSDDNHASRVVMGGVPYRSSILSERKSWNGKDQVIVTVPIGACDVDPGREWTVEDHTQQTFTGKLRASVKAVEEQYLAKIKAEMQQFTKLVDCSDWYNSLSSSAAMRANEVIYAELRLSKDKLVYYKPTSVRGERDVPWIDTLLSGDIIFMVKDKASLPMKRAQKLMADKNKRYCFVVNEKSDIINNPWLEGMVYKASDVIFEKAITQRALASYERQKGHRVYVVRQGQPGFSIDQVSREDIKNADSWAIRDGVGKSCYGYVTSVSAQGIKYFHASDNSDQLLINAGVKEIYILTEHQSKWADKDRKFSVKISDKIVDAIVINKLRVNDYNKAVNEINNYRLALGIPGRLRTIEKPELPSWLPKHLISDLSSQDFVIKRAEDRMAKVETEVDKLEKEVNARFPLLFRLKGSIDYTDKHVRNYIKAIEALRIMEGK